MIKTITKVGNSQGIIFDAALLQLARLKVGDQVNVDIHPGGTITTAPMDRQVIVEKTAGATAQQLSKKNRELFRRLA